MILQLKELSQATSWLNTNVVCTYQSFASNFGETCTWEIETNDSMIIQILFPSPIIYRIKVDSEVLVSTVEQTIFTFNQPYLGKYL